MNNLFVSEFASKVENYGQPFVVMPVGIPGSGKSTAMLALANTLGIERICPDEIRKELTGDASDQSQNALVWQTTHQRVGDNLRANKSTIVDATHVNPEQRLDAINMYRRFGMTVAIAMVFDVELQVAKERNKSRDRTVPEHVLDRMYKSMKKYPVRKSEGFSRVLYVAQNEVI